MKTIPLSQGYVALVDDEDFEQVNQFKWRASKRSNTLYAQTDVQFNGWVIKIYMHKLVMPCHSQLDHKNGNGLDNRKSNLRPATNSQNSFNRKKSPNTSSKFKGVWLAYGKWSSKIRCNGKGYWLGTWENEVDAAKAYNEAAKRLFGEFARLNEVT